MSHPALTFLANLGLALWYSLKGLIMLLVPARFLEKDVDEETVLITGGGSGIGQLMAVRFAKLGARIVVWDVNQAGMEQTCKLVREVDGEAHSYFCDVSDRKSVYATAEKVKEEVGPVSILINNAGIVNGKNFLEVEDEKIEKVFNVNTLAQFWVTKAFLPDMVKSGQGHLVFIASVAAFSGTTRSTDYSASKAAVLLFQESLRLELRASGLDGIKTTVVCPFFITTGLFEGAKSSIVPLLEPDHVADKIVSGVRCDTPVLVLPWHFTLLSSLKWILPVDAQLAVYDLFNGQEMMADFTGRADKKAS